jgi:vesicle coat complex subunit
MKDILRKYNEHCHEILGSIETIIGRVEDPEGKAAVIWMMGEFGELITEAPYILEDFIKNLKNIESSSITYSLLTATVKLFLKRAPEMQLMLGSLFQQIFEESDNPDLKDRAGFYYKILRNP